MQDDREILQACEQELARRQASLQALLPTTPLDEAADGAAPAEDSPAVTVSAEILPVCKRCLPSALHERMPGVIA